MSGFVVALRGIRWRLGRSLVVLLLATVAVAAAVIIPLYTAAAQRSVLADALAPERAGPVAVTATSAGSSTSLPAVEEVRHAVGRGLAVSPTLTGLLTETAAYVDDVARPVGVQPSIGEIVYRDGVCPHLAQVAGRCAELVDEMMISERAAADLHLNVGDKLALQAGRPRLQVPGQAVVVDDEPPADPVYRIAGIYRPLDPDGAYWGTTAYFGVGGFKVDPDSETITLDAMFVGQADGVTQIPEGRPQAHIDYRLRADEVKGDSAQALRRELEGLVSLAGTAGVSVQSELPTSLAEAAAEWRAIRASVPVVALPLVLICWFVLFLVVAALADERGAEIALGKLRGLGPGAVSRFGVAEPLLLVAAAAVPGLALGVLVTVLADRAFLAPGGRILLGLPVLPVVAAGLAALAGAVLAAALGARRTIGASVITLLRRVPPRARRAATAAEAAVAVLAAAALAQVLVAGDRTSPIAYAAAPIMALLAGLLTARLLLGWARRRLATAGARGRLAAQLAGAQVARRRGSVRLVAALTVAVAMVTFAATVWDAAGFNRERVARAAIGADQVFTVTARDVGTLKRAVDRADPGGHGAMAVVRSRHQYGGGYLQLIGVDTDRMAAVTRWPGWTEARVAELARQLSPGAAAPVRLRGPRVEVTATVDQLTQTPGQPMGLALLVARPGAPATPVSLGRLALGRRVYEGRLDCPDGCRLVGIAVRRFIGDFTRGAVRLRIAELRDAGRPVDAGIGDGDHWRVLAAGRPAGQTLSVATTAGELEMSVTTESAADIVAEYGDTPAAAPAVLAGDTPADDRRATDFAMPALGSDPEAFRVVDRVPLLPRGGDRGVLFDLSTLVSAAERRSGVSPDLTYEVWADNAVGPDLAQRLTEGGVVVRSVETRQRRLTELDRAAPALALRLYLLAGAVALLLALGAVLLDAYTGVRWRRREIAALRIAGVPPSTLRRALLREYRMLLGAPLLAGAAAGVGGALLILPAIPLVDVGDLSFEPEYRLAAWWLIGAVLVLVAAFLAVAALVTRMARPAEAR